VVLVRAHSNRIDDLRPLVPQILDAVAPAEPGKVRLVGAWLAAPDDPQSVTLYGAILSIFR
jgi:hypothetical protein